MHFCTYTDVYGFSRRFAPNNPQSLLGGVLHNPLMVGGLSAFLFLLYIAFAYASIDSATHNKKEHLSMFSHPYRVVGVYGFEPQTLCL